MAAMKDDAVVSSTYIAGEDNSRLSRAARNMGLESARKPLQNVRMAVGAFLNDNTLESARMHSVGALGRDERVDSSGTLHLMTLTKRKRRSIEGGVPDYGTLHDLFRREPIEIGGEEEMEEVVDIIEGGSLTAAVFGIVKGTVGPAILYLPRGFEISGYAVAIPSMILATTAYLYSASRLLQCWQIEKQKFQRMEEIRNLLEPVGSDNKREESVNEPRAGKGTTLLTYPELARRAFGGGSAIVQIGIALMQFGVCLTYLIFVPQNLFESTRALFGVEIDKITVLVTMVAIEIPLTWIRDIRKLTPTNVLATFLIAYGLISCLAIACSVMIKDQDFSIVEKIMKLSPVHDTWYLFIGTSVSVHSQYVPYLLTETKNLTKSLPSFVCILMQFFVFEGSITLLVPLQEAVFRDEDKKKFPSVNITVTSSIVVFYFFFAITCWAAFGSSVKTALTASLPASALATSVQFAYSIAVIFSFPLQAFPALEVVSHPSDYSHESKSDLIKHNVLASFITCSLGVVAFLAIDYLGNVVSLLGSLVGIPIALIYPPLMHNKLVKGSQETRLMNNCVACIGVIAMACASFTTIMQWDKGAE